MVFAVHYRVSAIGRIGSGGASEHFQYGFNCAGDVFDQIWNIQEHDRYNDVANDVYNFHSRSASRISSEAVLETVKIAKIGTDGKYIGDPKILTRVTGGGVSHDSNVLPQNALAVTLDTDRRGPTGRGRFYLPMPVVDSSPSDGFRITASVASTINGSVEELIEAVNNLPGLDNASWQVVVASSKGYNSPVTSVRVGRVVDNIRSRRRSLPEEYPPSLDVD